MTVYAEVKGDELIRFPYTHGSLIEENPFTNFGSDPDLAAIFPQTTIAVENGYNLAPVTYLDQPSYDPSTHICIQNELPTLIDGIWTLEWTISEMTPEQKTAYEEDQRKINRSKAMTLLQETDWTEIPSVTNTLVTPHLTNSSEFISYRTALRSVAVNPPIIVSWPTKPVEKWSS